MKEFWKNKIQHSYK